MKALYKLINWYTQHFRFPTRGWKYFSSFLRRTGLDKKYYHKKLHNGSFMLITPSEHIQQQIFWYGYYEKNSIRTWETLIKENFTILDIGANVGYYSVIASKKLKDGKVYAFEPATNTRKLLQENISLNKLDNIRVFPFAITDRSGEQDIYISNPENTGMSGLVPPENFSGDTEAIQTISIDEWMRTEQVERIDLIKIDVEGAEKNVLEGMKGTLSRNKPVIFIEIIPILLAKYKNTPGEIYQLLGSLGYSAFTIANVDLLRVINDNKEGDTIVFLPPDYILPEEISVIK